MFYGNGSTAKYVYGVNCFVCKFVKFNMEKSNPVGKKYLKKF